MECVYTYCLAVAELKKRPSVELSFGLCCQGVKHIQAVPQIYRMMLSLQSKQQDFLVSLPNSILVMLQSMQQQEGFCSSPTVSLGLRGVERAQERKNTL